MPVNCIELLQVSRSLVVGQSDGMNQLYKKSIDPYRVPVLLLLLLALSACATTEEESMVEAATTPLSDLNLVRKKIPGVLKDAAQAPYALPSDPSCNAVETEIDELGEVLGLDAIAGGKGLLSKGRDLAGSAAVDAMRRTAQGIMPMRDWVRKLTGAEKYSRQVSEAITSGLMRRSYLIGFFVAKGCVVEEEVDEASEEGTCETPGEKD